MGTSVLTRDMQTPVLHADGVYAHFFRYELDAVMAVLKVDDVAHFRHARRTCHDSLHVVGVCAYSTATHHDITLCIMRSDIAD